MGSINGGPGVHTFTCNGQTAKQEMIMVENKEDRYLSKSGHRKNTVQEEVARKTKQGSKSSFVTTSEMRISSSIPQIPIQFERNLQQGKFEDSLFEGIVEKSNYNQLVFDDRPFLKSNTFTKSNTVDQKESRRRYPTAVLGDDDSISNDMLLQKYVSSRYEGRFKILFLYVLLLAIDASSWICYASVSFEYYFGQVMGEFPHLMHVIFGGTLAYLLLYSPLEYFADMTSDERGIRNTMILASSLQFFGMLVRCFMSASPNFFFVGQILIVVSHHFTIVNQRKIFMCLFKEKEQKHQLFVSTVAFALGCLIIILSTLIIQTKIVIELLDKNDGHAEDDK
mmetsp:Transcript_5090/g.8674  ORF Transcript_5090/g.8674 Transcript_5090/m.8674 type:complete len:338 (+) Transcript_5090:533-1546(+)